LHLLRRRIQKSGATESALRDSNIENLVGVLDLQENRSQNSGVGSPAVIFVELI